MSITDVLNNYWYLVLPVYLLIQCRAYCCSYHRSPGVLDCSVCTKEAPKVKTLKQGSRTIPRRREEVIKWNGWGYTDSQFALNENDDVSRLAAVNSDAKAGLYTSQQGRLNLHLIC